MTQPADPFLAYGLAHDLLTSASEVLAESTTEGVTVPDRQFVSHAAPVADCQGGQLSVHLHPLRVMPTKQLPNAKICQLATVGLFTITWIDCAVTPGSEGNIPSAAALDAEAKRSYEVAWRLWAGLTARWSANTLLPNYGCPCSQVSFGQMTPMNQGGVIIWSWPVEIQLDDVRSIQDA